MCCARVRIGELGNFTYAAQILIESGRALQEAVAPQRSRRSQQFSQSILARIALAGAAKGAPSATTRRGDMQVLVTTRLIGPPPMPRAMITRSTAWRNAEDQPSHANASRAIGLDRPARAIDVSAGAGRRTALELESARN